MELTPGSLGLMAALVLFALQLILCLKTKRLAVRLVPLYIAAGFALYAAATFLGLFGTYSAGALAGHELAGIVLFFAAGAAAVGSLLGWAVFALASKLRDSRPARPEGGGTYCGCYYSFDGVPLPFQNADVPLAQTGDERWEWRAEGDNRGSTEQISEK